MTPMEELMEGYPEHADAVRLPEAPIHDDPAAFHNELRRTYGPVVPVLLDADVPAWLVIGYRELHYVTSQPQLFGRDPRRWNLLDRLPADWPARLYVTWQPNLMYSEGEERRRRGSAVSDALDSVDRTELTRICEHVADLVIDRFSGTGEADLVSQYAQRIPADIVTRLFGMPEVDLPDFVKGIHDLLDGGKDAATAYPVVYAHMERLVAVKRARPGHDVTSRLLAHDARLTDEETVADLMVLVGASHAASANWIGNTLRLMLVDDHFSMTLQGGRSSVGEALNEVLWKDTPTMNMPSRYAARDCELAGRRIRRGDLVVLGFAAANTDPQVQPAAHPGGSGANRAHMSFSHGEYGCPFPAPELGEIITKTAVEVLLDRLPDVHLAMPPQSLRWRPSLWARSLDSLPVLFTPTAPMGQLSWP